MADNKISISELGNRIAYYRKKKLLTQKELGDRLDISDKTISKWEKGTVAPDITVLENLTRVLEVRFDDLLALENEERKIKKKRKFNCYFIIIVSMLALCSGFISYYIEKRNKEWIAHEIYSLNDQYYVEGYILDNRDVSRILISKLYYKNDNFDVLNINVELFMDEEKIFEWYFDEKNYDLNGSLDWIRDKMQLEVDKIDYELIEAKKFYIKISYQTKDMKMFDRTIYLGLV